MHEQSEKAKPTGPKLWPTLFRAAAFLILAFVLIKLPLMWWDQGRNSSVVGRTIGPVFGVRRPASSPFSLRLYNVNGDWTVEPEKPSEHPWVTARLWRSPRATGFLAPTHRLGPICYTDFRPGGGYTLAPEHAEAVIEWFDVVDPALAAELRSNPDPATPLRTPIRWGYTLNTLYLITLAIFLVLCVRIGLDLYRLARLLLARRRLAAGRCPRCRYPIGGMSTCPECGYAIHPRTEPAR